MKTINSNNEKLQLGVNYKECSQETWDGIKWTSYIATIGNENGKVIIACMSKNDLQNEVSKFVFKTNEDAQRHINAIDQFGTSH